MLAAIGLLAACDRSDSTTGPADRTAQEDGLRVPIRPQTHGFKLPADWEEQHPTLSPNAKVAEHFRSLARRAMTPDSADGGGQAWLEAVIPIDPEAHQTPWRRESNDPSRPSVPVGSIQRIEIGFEVGEHGIDEGGRLFVMPEPFWSWSKAQVENPNALGFTTARALSRDVELLPMRPGAVFQVKGHALRPGERIDIVLGAGRRGTRVDELAGRDSEILIGVDADGDGTRRWLDRSVLLDIAAAPGVQLVAFGPAEVEPGDPIEISIAILDEIGNRARWPSAVLEPSRRLETLFTIGGVADAKSIDVDASSEATGPSGPDAPYRIGLTAPDRESTIRLAIRGRGVLEGLAAKVNPIVVRHPTGRGRLVWADLHGHSGFSDGTGTPDDYFRYARDVARLDVVALTDHDHAGVRPLDESPVLVEQIMNSVAHFHDPGRFVTIPGYEWTSWLHGHRHVLYFEEHAPLYSSVDPATDRPDELWDALRGEPALTFAHHSAGEPVATNWAFEPDPELEPLTEIASSHGVSEAEDAPGPIRGGVSGNFVRDILARNIRLGFVGSGDSHDGHPGLTHLARGKGGLAGIFSESLDRPQLLAAMKQRSTFATNGIRPWLEVDINGTFMGGSLPESDGDPVLRVRYEAAEAIERVDLIRSGQIEAIDGAGALALDLHRQIAPLRTGDYVYVRIIETNGGVAWSSPIFVEDASPPPQVGSRRGFD